MTRAALNHWFTSSNRLLLDLRSLDVHYRRRIIPSACIPVSDLNLYWFELPPKSIPFAVLEPSDNKGVANQLLKDHGWRINWVFNEADDEVWKFAKEFNILEICENILSSPTNNNINNNNYSSGNSDCKMKKWFLFRPNPFLMNNIELIEQSLIGESFMYDQQKKVFNCLDVGCGSGRDICWLSARKSSGVDWYVTGMDVLTSALDRAKLLAKRMDVPHKIQTINAKILNNGNIKLLLPIREDENKEIITSEKEHKKESNEEILNKRYDLVLCIRFLNRNFFDKMINLVNPGGFLLLSTFVDDKIHVYERPHSDEHRLKLGELSEIVKNKYQHFNIIQDKIEFIEDGRPVNSFLVRRKSDDNNVL
ncbi:15986_t:CDS:1 [Entrophospora sp. SA101]|nr:1189_t:CDS:1 [Entrophospora sp. SA101]CAJ0749122.1 13309_t:CDS:1 [Entrophospora sp. SA101]CAJ0754270.1 16053_t:CDS:1 [Entrophospora sp. SA101]CAJ0765004.1 15986_t:CDS:1 [Entrophospora sp. SA101]CAJ0823731.1 15948_t:CDS:1 [Entrophospora sp. SA101]